MHVHDDVSLGSISNFSHASMKLRSHTILLVSSAQ